MDEEAHRRTIEGFQRQVAQDQIRMCMDNVAMCNDYIQRLQASPQYQEQEARRRAIEELRMSGEDEAADMVAKKSL